MPRKLPSFTEYSHAPFTEDVEQLLARFQQTDSVRYEAFSAIWREMGFSEVYHGIVFMNEMRRFCRVTLATAVKYFLPPLSYQIRVGGLYLMYALYHTQLAIPPVHIRIPLKDWCHVEKFVQDSIRCGHYDVVYIFKKLVAKKAIHYTAMPHFLYFRRLHTPIKEVLCPDFVGRSTVIQDLLSADILEEMINIQNLYEKIKATMPEVLSKASMTHQDIASNLKDCMNEFIVWQDKTFTQKKRKRQDEKREEEREEPATSRTRLLSSIKQKSYGNVQAATKARRHRHVELVSDCNSEVEDMKTSISLKDTSAKKRSVSLYRRTLTKLGGPEEKKPFNNWLLTMPESLPEDRRLPPMHIIP